MHQLPLHLRDGHMFLEIDGQLWLIDTGSPASFGDVDAVTIAGRRFDLAPRLREADAAMISDSIGVACIGLLGAEVLGSFDHLWDAAGSTATLSATDIDHAGDALPLELLEGIPILRTRIRGVDQRMFFDTGAQFSFWEDDAIASFPPAGEVDDFHPTIGPFKTATHTVEIALGPLVFNIRCGRLPGSLPHIRGTLRAAGTSGIVGNEILLGRTTLYAPRRRLLVL